MDTKRILREKHKFTLTVAVALSFLVVVVAALLGRGFLQLKGSLTADEPSELTIVALVLQDNPDLSVINVTPLPYREGEDTHHFTYELKSGGIYMAEIERKDDGEWHFKQEPKLLHGSASAAP